MDALLAAHPTEIFQACDSVFTGEAWLSFEPETLLLELRQEVSEASVDKLLSVQAFASNPAAALSGAAAFEKTVNAFCNNICVMDVSQPPEVEELCYAVEQMRELARLAHGPDKPVTFIGEVPGYVAGVAHFRDWAVLPGPLAFAQDMLDNLTGLHRDSRLYKEHRGLSEASLDLAGSLTREKAQDLLHSGALDSLDGADPAQALTRRMVGALLYDPTLTAQHAAHSDKSEHS